VLRINRTLISAWNFLSVAAVRKRRDHRRIAGLGPVKASGPSAAGAGGYGSGCEGDRRA
jgi:hypothetical protein